MRRLHPLLIAALVLLPALGSCRRRAPGTCADHVDCDPGFDCVDRRCTRRASLQGEGATPPVPAGPDAESSEPARSPSSGGEEPAVAPAAPPPQKRATPPTRSPPGIPPGLEPAPAPAPGQREPLWKLRRKNS